MRLLFCVFLLCFVVHSLGSRTHGGLGLPLVCRHDMLKFCPNLHGPATWEQFEEPCFKDNEERLSPGCRMLMHKFRLGEHLKPTPVLHPGPPTNKPQPHPLPLPQPQPQPHPPLSVHKVVFGACTADKIKYCNDPHVQNKEDLFESKCFTDHFTKLTHECKREYEEFRNKRTLFIALVFSAIVAVFIVGVVLALLICGIALCCLHIVSKQKEQRYEQLIEEGSTCGTNMELVNPASMMQGMPVQFIVNPQAAQPGGYYIMPAPPTFVQPLPQMNAE